MAVEFNFYIKTKSGPYYPVGTVITVCLGQTLAQMRQEFWEPCDGREYEPSQFPELYDALKYTYGNKYPDLRDPDHTLSYKLEKPKVCECGADKHGFASHSRWCGKV